MQPADFARSASAPILAAALMQPGCFPHPVRDLRLLETHISWVLLTGDYAYKIRKPVNLEFLDFTTLAARRHDCEEELRLNRRFAPGLYLEVVAIRGSAAAPRVGGAGPALEYAVKMREFPQQALAAGMLARGEFGASCLDSLTDRIVAFHAASPPARAPDRFGAPTTVLAAALQNIDQMTPQAGSAIDRKTLHALRHWSEREFLSRRAVFDARKRSGYVRECHGDLHLGNVAVIDGEPVPFDCLEFSDTLRCIDVMSEAAFLFMDLADRGRSDLAWRFLNRYLEATGDYGGLEILRFYLVYRALVRAKVHLLRSRQPHLVRGDKLRLTFAYHDYLRLAVRFTEPRFPALIITHGLSGAGKTTATQSLVELLGAVRVRSDVERKRLHGFAPLAPSGSPPGAGIYTQEATGATYLHLAGLAARVLAAGYSAVVDAAFLSRADRNRFRMLAARQRVPFLILDFKISEEMLRERLVTRARGKRDASEADFGVLERQIAAQEPLDDAEAGCAISIPEIGANPRLRWQPLLERLRRMQAPQRNQAASGDIRRD